MKDGILRKLQNELNKDIKTEAQVIYILSRIRKILEIDKKKLMYSKLNFYCNWALHSQIFDTHAVEDMLNGIVARDNGSYKDLFASTHLHEELRRFLEDYNLSTSIYQSPSKFEMILAEIYADTPLTIINPVAKKESIVTLKIRPGRGGSFGLGLSVDSWILEN